MPVKTEKSKKSAPSRSAKHAESGRHVLTRVLLALLTLAVIALGLLLFLAKEGLLFPPKETPDAGAEMTESEKCRAVFYVPEGEPIVVSAGKGDLLVPPDGPEIEHYRFLGWADEKGRRLEDAELRLYADASFSAQYAVAFRSESGETRHEAYLPLDADGCFRPFSPLTRREAAEILFSLLDTDAVGSGSFADVKAEDSCFLAAATLKDLGVIGGSRFHPDEGVSHAEFYEMLAAFYPPCGVPYAFDNISESDSYYSRFCLARHEGWLDDPAVEPDSDLTRAEAAHIFNLLRGRGAVAETNTAKVGTILDVSFRDPYFWDIAEASIAHDCENGGENERWAQSEALPLREEGFFFIGTELHCIDSEGSPLVNETSGNFRFGPDGAYTTGLPELDELVQAKFKELKLDPQKMTTDLMLRKCYDNVTYHSRYLKGDTYEVGATGWELDAAYRMLAEGKGNCYCFAGSFAVLARSLGYDAICYSGTVGPRKSPHGWVEISFDDVPYVFDTNLEYEEHMYKHKTTCMYKLPPARAKGWHYVKEAEQA